MNTDPTPLVDILSHIKLTVIKSECFNSNDSYSAITLDGANLKESRTSNIFVEQALITVTDLSKSKWIGLETIELLCRYCNIANADWSGARMMHTEFHNTRLTGCDFSCTKLRDVLFYHCKIDLSIFHDSQLTGCRFHGCDLRETDFQNASLKRVVFRDCDLRNSRYPGASLSEIDLRGSQVAGMYADANELQGAIVDPFQVADIASMIGLVVNRLPADSPTEYTSRLRHEPAENHPSIQPEGET